MRLRFAIALRLGNDHRCAGTGERTDIFKPIGEGPVSHYNAALFRFLSVFVPRSPGDHVNGSVIQEEAMGARVYALSAKVPKFRAYFGLAFLGWR